MREGEGMTSRRAAFGDLLACSKISVCFLENARLFCQEVTTAVAGGIAK
jgi:hypothetical protein